MSTIILFFLATENTACPVVDPVLDPEQAKRVEGSMLLSLFDPFDALRASKLMTSRSIIVMPNMQMLT